MADDDPRSDDQLLRSARSDPDAFALLYRRHVHALLGYFSAVPATRSSRRT